MEIRRMYLHGLRHLDEAVIRVFLRLLEQDKAMETRWIWVNNDAADLVLLDPHAPGAAELTARLPACAWVLDRHAPAPDDWVPYLRRPLQFEELVELLKRTQYTQACAHATKPPPSDVSVAPPSPPEDAPVAAPPPPATVTRWRLRRWPATSLLQGHPHYRRLASFLLSKPLSLAELVARSQCEYPVCADFLRLLQATDLLAAQEDLLPPAEDEPPAVLIDEPAPHSASSAEAGSAPSGTLSGLLSRLRHHLGMASG